MSATVWAYVYTSKQVAASSTSRSLKVFANQNATETWFKKKRSRNRGV